MPDLDVTDILLDPDLCEVLTIWRREQTVSAKGRAGVPAPPVVIAPAPVGVVLPVADQPLVRGPDQQNLPRLLEVHTPFRLRSASKDPATGKSYQPDIIVWNGDPYVVNKVQDYSRFGQGFIQADCSSTDPIDNVPV